MTDVYNFELLGGISLLKNGIAIGGKPTRAAQALLVYVLHQKRPVQREQLIDLLFQTSEPKQASANLRSTLSRLKKELDTLLLIDRDSVSVRPDAQLTIDSTDLLARLAEPHNDDVDHLEAALALYEGDFLAGFYLRDAPEFEQWMLIERERLRLRVMDALWLLLRMQEAAGQWKAARKSLDRLLQIEPLLEDAQRLRMLLLARSGQRALALRHYAELVALFEEELAISVSAETTTLYKRIRNLPDKAPHNLPPERTTFIGRDRERRDLCQLVTSSNQRLVTLLGAGGMGKTALALQIARELERELRGHFLDGIFFVPLAELDSAELLPLFLSDALGVSQRGEKSSREQLFEYLKDRELLLLLDNFEQLLPEGADLIADILEQAPAVKLIVTTRQRLYIYEERIVDLYGLETPEETLRQIQVGQYASIDLFAARALQQQGSFSIEAETAAVARSCRLLEGMPLAIELAAAWVRDFDCAQIADEIEKGMAFLRSEMRNVPDRHRSIRAVFNHSWRLLSAEAQSAFAALSIFPASFSTTAAIKIAEVDGNMLSSLRDRSLLQEVDDGRYQLHATLREFSAEKCTDTSNLAKRHAAYYIAEIDHISETFLDKEGFALMRRELPNLNTTWRWTLDSASFDETRRLLRPMFEYFNWSNTWLSGIAFFERALALVPASQRTVRAMLLARLCHLNTVVARLDAADRFAQDALVLFETLDEDAEEAALLGNWGRAYTLRGDFEQAVELGERGLGLAFSAEDAEAIAFNHSLLGSAYKALGEHANARTHLQSALELRRSQNDSLGEAILLNNVGNLLIDQNEFSTALEVFEQAATLFRDLEHAHGSATVLSNAATAAGRLENYEEVERLQEESLVIKRQLGNERSIALSLALLGDARTYLGRYDEAKETLLEGLRLCRTIEDTWALDELVVSFADWYLGQGLAQDAARLLATLKAQDALRAPLRERVKRLIGALPEGVDVADSPEPRREIVSMLLNV